MTVQSLQIPKLGWCNVCKQWLVIIEGKSSLPIHKNQARRKCHDSEYSPDKWKYKIETQKQAEEVAHFILNDNGCCLHDTGGHSLACGDGDWCEKIRIALAKALAEYFFGSQPVANN